MPKKQNTAIKLVTVENVYRYEVWCELKSPFVSFHLPGLKKKLAEQSLSYRMVPKKSGTLKTPGFVSYGTFHDSSEILN